MPPKTQAPVFRLCCIVAPNWRKLKCLSVDRITKMWYVHIMKYTPAVKMNQVWLQTHHRDLKSKHLIVFCFCFISFFQNKVSLCNPDWSSTLYAAKDHPAPTSEALGLQGTLPHSVYLVPRMDPRTVYARQALCQLPSLPCLFIS